MSLINCFYVLLLAQARGSAHLHKKAQKNPHTPEQQRLSSTYQQTRTNEPLQDVFQGVKTALHKSTSDVRIKMDSLRGNTSRDIFGAMHDQRRLPTHNKLFMTCVRKLASVQNMKGFDNTLSSQLGLLFVARSWLILHVERSLLNA